MTRFLTLYWLVECLHQTGQRELTQYESHALLPQAEAAAQAYHAAGWDMVSISPLWVDQGQTKRMVAAGRIR